MIERVNLDQNIKCDGIIESQAALRWEQDLGKKGKNEFNDDGNAPDVQDWTA